MSEIKTLKIDGVSYSMDQLSTQANGLLQELRLIEAEMARLKVQMGISQIAQRTVLAQLKAQLPPPTPQAGA